MKKITCFIIAPIGGKINQKCLDSVMTQDYGKFDVLIHYEKPVKYDEVPMVNTYKNCSFNRNVARKMALTTDADYFLVLDDDIELPKDAISNFMIQAEPNRKCSIPVKLPDGKTIPSGNTVPDIHIQGGWYPIFGGDDGALAFYPCGEFVADNTIERYYQPQASFTRVDYVGMGCMFITRKALEDTFFSNGLDTWVTCQSDNKAIISGECLAFGNIAHDKGYAMYMNGDVICKHHKKYLIKRRILWKLRSFKTSFTVLMGQVIRLLSGMRSRQQSITMSTQ